MVRNSGSLSAIASSVRAARMPRGRSTSCGAISVYTLRSDASQSLPRKAKGAVSAPVDTPVTRSKTGRPPRSDQPFSSPAPKAPSSPPPETPSIS